VSLLAKDRNYPKAGHDGWLRSVEKPCHERVDPLHHAGLGQRRADKAPRALKFDVFGQGHGCGEGFRLARGLGDGAVERIGRIETRNRQVEHDLVEVTRAPLPARLEALTAGPRDFAVEKSGEVKGFLLRIRLGRLSGS
jgi:hypothetical protein